MQKGSFRRGKRKFSLSKTQRFKLTVLKEKVSRVFHRLSQEKRYLLRFSSIFIIGHVLLLIGGMNLHNNFVIFVLLGVTSIIFAVSLLSKDMDNTDENETSNTDYKILDKEKPIIYSTNNN